MNLASLSGSALAPFGTLLKSRPQGDGLKEEYHTLVSGAGINVYRCDRPVTVDYAEGMTALAICGASETVYYYLDRIVQIGAGVAFSLVCLEGTAGVVVIRPEDTAVELVEARPPLEPEEKTRRFALGKIFTVFYQETSGNFYFRGESHSAYELAYVDQGSLHNIINGHDYVLSQQECIIIDRDQWHIQYSALPVKFLTVSFSHTGELSRWLTDRVIHVPSAIRPILSRILREKKDNPLSAEYLEALVQIFLIELIRKPNAGSTDEKAPSTSFSENLLVDKALKMISRNISGKIVLSDLANELHISVPYLYRLFDEHLKMPPGRYIMMIRLEESKMLLREGRKSIGDVAREYGFTSIQHYSRQFKAHFGISPSEYIRSLR